ncbi:MAG: hypothetical protein CM15mP68_6000 [Pseudomonadota bacterium]|nr:MAG: hypothetical protein CM15mP68_6000 [Pseudomonadota bacterium]
MLPLFGCCLLVVFLTGVTSATYATASALIADVSPPEERAQNFGLLGLAFGLGFIFGPTIGGLIGAWDLRAPFFVAAALAFINTAYGFFFLQETLGKDTRRVFELKRANPLGALKQIKRYPILLGMIIGVFIFSIGHHVYPANWNFYAIEKFSWTPFEIGLSMGFVGLLAAIVQGGLIRIVIPKFGAVTVCDRRTLLRRYRVPRPLRSPLTLCLYTLGAWCPLSQVYPVPPLQASCLTSCRKTNKANYRASWQAL